MSGRNGNGHRQLTAEELKQLAPLSAGDYYWAKTNAPKGPDGEFLAEDFAFFAMAHAAKRRGLVETDDVYEFLDRVDISAITEAAGALTEELSTEGPLTKTRTTSSRRSATSGG